MKAKYVFKNKFKERRLTFGKEYEILDSFIIVELLDDGEKEVRYITIIDDVGDRMNYAMEYGTDVWFIDRMEMRDKTLGNLLDS